MSKPLRCGECGVEVAVLVIEGEVMCVENFRPGQGFDFTLKLHICRSEAAKAQPEAAGRPDASPDRPGRRGPLPAQTNAARSFFLQMLLDGPIPQADAIRRAKAEGFRETTACKALRRLIEGGHVVRSPGESNTLFWLRLPE